MLHECHILVSKGRISLHDQFRIGIHITTIDNNWYSQQKNGNLPFWDFVLGNLSDSGPYIWGRRLSLTRAPDNLMALNGMPTPHSLSVCACGWGTNVCGNLLFCQSLNSQNFNQSLIFVLCPTILLSAGSGWIIYYVRRNSSLRWCIGMSVIESSDDLLYGAWMIYVRCAVVGLQKEYILLNHRKNIQATFKSVNSVM